MKRCSALLIIREMQTKPQREVTSHPLRWPLPKQKMTVDTNMEKLKFLCTINRNGKWFSNYKKTVWSLLKNLKIEPYDSAISLFIQRGISKRYFHTHVHCSIIHNSQEVEEIQISIDRWIKQIQNIHRMEYLAALKKILSHATTGMNAKWHYAK